MLGEGPSDMLRLTLVILLGTVTVWSQVCGSTVRNPRTGLQDCVGVASGGAVGATGDIQKKASDGSLSAAGINDNGTTISIPSRTVSIGTALPAGAPAGTIGAVVNYSPTTPLNIRAFGAKGDARMLTDGVTTGTTTLTSTNAAFTTADTGKYVIAEMGTYAVYRGTYVSGITATGSNNATCTLTSFNGGGSGAVAHLVLTGTNTLGSTVFFTSFGSGYTAAPTTATVGNGTATCTGTPVITTNIFPLPVVTTATYVNATTITLGVAATYSGTGVKFTIGTNDTTVIQSAITQAQANAGAVYIPAGLYLITGLTISAQVAVFGDSASGVWGNVSGAGANIPTVSPYLQGSVLLMAAPNTDAISATVVGNGMRLSNFGILFDPTIALWQTGHGINANANGQSQYGQISGYWDNLLVWGTDGNHYSFRLVNPLYFTSIGISSFSGGGIHVGNASSPQPAGNATFVQPYCALYGGGSSSAISVTTDSGASYNNLLTWIRPQGIGAGTTSAPFTGTNLSSWPVSIVDMFGSGTAQWAYVSPSTQLKQAIISPDFEGLNPSYPTGDSDFLCLGVTCPSLTIKGTVYATAPYDNFRATSSDNSAPWSGPQVNYINDTLKRFDVGLGSSTAGTRLGANCWGIYDATNAATRFKICQDGAAQFVGGTKSADGSAGVSGATCSAWKNGLCVAN